MKPYDKEVNQRYRSMYKVKKKDDFGQIAKENNLCRSYSPLKEVGKVGLKLTYH